MATEPVKSIVRQVKPFLSTNENDARRRVLKLYKMWIRNLPNFLVEYNLPVPFPVAKAKIRDEFLKNKHVRDIRVIDMLVTKGQMEFNDMFHRIKQRCQVMYMFKDTRIPQKTDFLSKFFSGPD